MSDSVPTTRGTILRGLLRFIERDLDSDQYARVLALLPAIDRNVIQQDTVDVRQRVSEFTLNRLTIEAAKVKGEDLDTFGRRAGRAELTYAIGTYRFFVSVLTPTALLRKASTLWTDVHSHGSFGVETIAAGNVRVRLVDFPSEEAHCARLTGWFEGAGEMTRAKDLLVIHDVCMLRGGTDCQWHLRWQR